MGHFCGHLASYWAPAVTCGRHLASWGAPGYFLVTRRFFCWPRGVLAGTRHLGGHPEFHSVGTWFLLATWPLGGHLVFILVASCRLGGHPVFFWVTTKHLGGHLTSLQAPSISFHWQPASWWVPSISFDGHMVLWLAPSFSVGRHVAFILLGRQRFFSWPCVILVATCNPGRHLAFLLLGTLCFGCHLLCWWAPSTSCGGQLASS